MTEQFLVRDDAGRLDRALASAERRLLIAWLALGKQVAAILTAARVRALLRDELTVDDLAALAEPAILAYAEAVEAERARSGRDTAAVVRAAGIPFLWTADPRGSSSDSNAATVAIFLADSIRRALQAGLRAARESQLGERSAAEILRAFALTTEAGAASLFSRLTGLLRERESGDTGRAALTISAILLLLRRQSSKLWDARRKSGALSDAETAVHSGAESVFERLVAAGYRVVSRWRTRRDNRVRRTHAPMDGQEQQDGSPFVSGAGALLAFPGDPAAPASERIGCRCSLERTVSRPQ